MKIIIDIPETAYEAYKEWHKNKVASVEQSIIANGKPYEERPTGHWVPKKCNFYWYRQFACSECGHEIICRKKTPNLCEECGADMRGGKQ